MLKVLLSTKQMRQLRASTYVCIHIIYIYVYTLIYIYIYVYTLIYIYIYTYGCICIYTCVIIYILICLQICKITCYCGERLYMAMSGRHGPQDGDLCRVVREAQLAKSMLPESMASGLGNSGFWLEPIVLIGGVMNM